jgi:Flp pilus assembly pilin Flp
MPYLSLHFLRDETGQDLIEYTLLLAFIAMASAALLIGVGSSVNGVWDEGSELLSHANRAAGRHPD